MTIFFQPYELYRVINLSDNQNKIKIPEGINVLYFKGKNLDKPEFINSGETVKYKNGMLHCFRKTPFELSTRMNNLKTLNGYDLTVDMQIRLEVTQKEYSNHADFIATIVNNRDKIKVSDIETYIFPEFRRALEDFAKTRNVSEIVETDLLPKIEVYLRSQLNRILISSGLEFLGITRALFHSDEYNKLKFNDAEMLKEQEFQQQNKEMRDIWDKIEKDESLEKHEFEAFMKELEHKKIIHELKHSKEQYDEALKSEEAYKTYEEQKFNMQNALEKLELDKQLSLDRKKFQERLEQAKIALRTLENAPTEYFVSLIEDEKLRAKLYEELILQKMTPEQLKLKKFPEIDERVDRKLRDFYEKIKNEISKGFQKTIEPGLQDNADMPIITIADVKRRTKRVLLPVNRKVFAYQPGSLAGVETPKETYDFQNFELGSIRSVSVIKMNGEDMLVAGARRGVYITPMFDSTRNESTKKIRRYALYTSKDFEGGVNSVAHMHDFLWCAHSEAGLQRICVGIEDMLAVPVLREITEKARTIRGITRYKNQLFFAADNNIYSFTPETDGGIKQEPIKYEGATDEITSFVISESKGSITAGTRSGLMLRWDIGNPYVALKLKKQNNTVYMLKPLNIASIEHMIFGNKQTGAIAMTINNDVLDMQVVYKCKDKIRWVDGADDFIFGTTSDLNAVNIWYCEDIEHVIWRIVPGGKIQDICLWTETTV
ncbi:MAG: hypothetical protein K8S87_12830 [Planctomycetes bacterium]|nr:hypothetical protein [Planctomycetota bacterium]